MVSEAVVNQSRSLGLLAVGLAALVCGSIGCAPRVANDIVAINQYTPTVPWVFDEEGRVVGMRARVYMVSASTSRGEFVPGTIEVELRRLLPRRDGTFQRELLHTWTFPEPRARDYRIVSKSVMGNSYGLVLRWPEDLELIGEEVQLTYRYTRADGGVVTRHGSRFRVTGPRGTPMSHRMRIRDSWDVPTVQQAPTTQAAPRENKR